MLKLIGDGEPVIVTGNADLHSNSSVGLCPPVVHRAHGDYIQHPLIRGYLWNNWLDYWKHVKNLKRRYKAKVVAVFNGDTGEDNKHNSPQVIATSRDEIKTMALDTIAPSAGIADEYYMVEGTEAHDGRGHELLKIIAAEIGAVKDPMFNTWTWAWLPLLAGGVLFDIAHHPFTNSTRAWTVGAAANRESAASVYDSGISAYYGEIWTPQIRWRAHVHHFEDSGDTHPVRTLYSRPWRLTDNYDQRIGYAGKVAVVGGFIWICRDGQYLFEDRCYRAKRRDPVEVRV